MGPFSGQLGPVIGYSWKGRACMRTKQLRPKNPRTKKQQQNRMVFGITSKLGTSMAIATGIGLRSIADERRTCIVNIFISLNHHCINVEDDRVNINYSALKIADGQLTPVSFGEAVNEGGMQVGVDYSKAAYGGANDDYVYLLAYAPSLEQSHLSMPTARSAHHISMTLPTLWQNREVHLYGFVWDHDRNASPSSYLGNLTLT